MNEDMIEVFYSYELCDRKLNSPLVFEDICSMVGSRHIFSTDPNIVNVISFNLCSNGINEVINFMDKYGAVSIIQSIREELSILGVPQNCRILFYLKGDKFPVVYEESPGVVKVGNYFPKPELEKI